MKKLKNTSIHSRFFNGMSLIAIGFMIVLMVGTSLLFYKFFFNLESSAALKQLDYISSQFDNYLTSVTNYSKTIIIDPAIQDRMRKYQNNKDSFNANDQSTIREQISRIIQSTPFIHSVAIYSADTKLITTTEIFPFNSTLKTIPPDAKGSWSPMLKHPSSNKHANIEVISYVKDFYDYNTAELLGYIEISIPEQTISSIYKDKTTQSNHIFAADAFGTIRSSDNTEVLDTPYVHFSKLRHTDGDETIITNKAIILSKYFPTLNWYIINEINLIDFVLPMFSLFLIILIITIACILACLIVSHRVSRSITSPIDHLINHTRKIKEGNWLPLDETCEDNEIGHLFHAFNSMITAQEKLKNDLLKSQKMKAKISLDLLQQQVNPHFLYNTLDNICSLAEIDEKESLIDIVMNLSTFYREGLSNGKFYISIKEELEITRAYLHIMQVRYYNKFDFTIQCPASLMEYPCLKLLLQPIVENSIYHGIKEFEYRGFIEIIITEEADCIKLNVLDNGVGIDAAAMSQIWKTDSDHFGIKNIHQRIQLYYGEEYGLTIINRPDGGCIAAVRIGKEAKHDVIESSDRG